MRSIKGHFDGTAVVLDEPATLAIGQAVRTTVLDAEAAEGSSSPPAPWKGIYILRSSPAFGTLFALLRGC